jgi:photosystem II stability/assembly factor-like uncharacterized protein
MPIAADNSWNDADIDADGSFMLVAGDDDLYVSTDSGANWTNKDPGGTVSYLTACVADSTTKAIALDDWFQLSGKFWASTDSGANWSEKTVLVDADEARLVAYTSGDQGGLYVQRNDERLGQVFTYSTDFNLTDVKLKLYKVGTPGTNLVVSIYAVSGGVPTGSPLKSVNYATSNITATSAPGAWYTIPIDLDGLSASTYYAIVLGPDVSDWGWGNFIYCRKDGSGGYNGGTLVDENSGVWSADGAQDYVFEVWGVGKESPTVNQVNLGAGGDFVLTLTDDGVVYSSDLGSSWTQKFPDANEATNWDMGICSTDGSYMIVVSDADAIYRSADSGTSWAAITPAGGDTFVVNDLAISSDGQYAIIVGTNSTDSTKSAYISTDYGASWTAYNPVSGSYTWTRCAISNNGQVIGVSKSGDAYFTFDGGTTWTAAAIPATSTAWDCLSISGDGKVGIIANVTDNDEFFQSSGWYSKIVLDETALTAAARSILDDSSTGDIRTTLGVGTGDSPTFTGLTLTSIAAEATDVDKFLVDSAGVIKYRTGAEVLSDIGASASSHLHDTAALQHDAVNSDGGAFSFTTTGTVTFNQSIASTNLSLSGYIDLAEISEPSTPAANNLRLYVEDREGFSVYKYLDSGGMKREVLRDSMILVYNNSGDTIVANRVVYASGNFNNVPTVALAKANSESTMPAIGVTIESIANGAYGRVMQVGLLEDIDTSALSVGDVLYVHDTVAGVVRITPPTTPALIQEIGTVLVDNVSTGAIQIVARGMSGNEYGTVQNSFSIGDGSAGSKVLTFNSASDATITWDESQFDFSQAIASTNYAAANKLTACATNAGALDFSAGSKTLTVEDNAVVSQDYTSDASPTFAGLVLSGTVNVGLNLSGGTFATASIDLPATPIIHANGTQIIKFDATNYNLLFGSDAFQNTEGQYNIGIGYQAGYYNDDSGGGTDGDENIFIGSEAGKGDSGGASGYRNTAIGRKALASISTGDYNFALGSYAGDGLTTGSHNVCIGSLCGRAITDSNENLFIGNDSGRYIESGAGNIGIGYGALTSSSGQAGITGNIGIGRSAFINIAGLNTFWNVAIGESAGYNHTTGDSCIYIGRQAGYNQTTNSDLLILDNQDRGSAAAEISDCLVYGSFNATVASQSIRFNAGDLTLASTAPYQNLINTTHEDGDGGRESRINFKGEQSGGELTTLARIQGSHDATADDEKGDLIFCTNDGNDGDSPTERARIDSSGYLGLGITNPLTAFHIEKSDVTLAIYAKNTNNAGRTFIQCAVEPDPPGADMQLGFMAHGTNYGGETFCGINSASTCRLVWENSTQPFIIYTDAAAPLVFGTTDTERMRLEADGDFVYGATTANANFDIQGTCRFGDGTTNYTAISASGDVSFAGSAGFYPVRLSQSAQPTPATGELIMWRDPDDNKTYMVYQDTDEGTRKVELT